MIFRRILVICLLFFPALSAAADDVTLRMDFYYGDTKVGDVRTELNLSDDGRTYQITSYTAALGLAKLLYGDTSHSSSGYVDAQHGLLMTLYTSQRGRREPQRAELNGAQLHLQRGEEKRTETVNVPVFDYLSSIYRSYILAMPVGGNIKYTNGWRLTEYEFNVEGMETVQTGMGEMEAVLLIRHSDRGARKIWLAPALGYLPVRLYVDDKGHEFTSVLQVVEK